MGGRRSGTERDQIWISGLGWYVIRRTTATGGRYGGGSVGRSHRGGTLRVLRPAKYDKSSSLTRVEPPRWFTARRKLVKFKSAFKTGLARCPGPLPAAGTAGERYRRAPTGVYRSNILGKLRMDFPPQPISSGSASNRRFFRASRRVVVRPSVRFAPSVLSPRHENSSNRPYLGTKSSRRSSVKIPGETSRTMLPPDRTLLAPH